MPKDGRRTVQEVRYFLKHVFARSVRRRKSVVRSSEIVVHRPEQFQKYGKRRSRVCGRFWPVWGPVLGPGWGQD